MAAIHICSNKMQSALKYKIRKIMITMTLLLTLEKILLCGLGLQSIETITVGQCWKFVAPVLLEMIFIRNGAFWVNLPCFLSNVQFLISHMASM